MREAVGNNIKARREALGLTQAELAERVVKNQERGSYISLVESGKTVIDIMRLGEFAVALSCQPSDLLVTVSNSFEQVPE
ncbi:helix-turn-helix domain-containing protein [Deinococcus navajonensis]|uniref:Helix-turn-helix domain-containing protein n=1 Tax=Deinococcus navajonensis TaxID=309884 RepID=A0ABV8XK31_9DEIO